MQETSFETWRKQVDEAMLRKYGLKADHFPDVDFWGLYKTGDTPEQAADYVFTNSRES